MDERAQRLLQRAIDRGDTISDHLRALLHSDLHSEQQTTHRFDQGNPGNQAWDSELVNWLRRSEMTDPPISGRYIAEIWRERTDLQETFPGFHVDPETAPRFLLWAHHFAASECGAPEQLIPSAPEGITDIKALPYDGPSPKRTNTTMVVGYLRSVLGLGEAARRLIDLFDLAGESICARSYDHTNSPLTFAWNNNRLPREDALPDIVIAAVNGTETARLSRALGEKQLAGAYRIGLWFWELEELTPQMSDGLQYLDEVWVTSEFVRDAVAAAVKSAGLALPVEIIPLGMTLPLYASPEPEIVVTKEREPRLRIGTSFDYASRILRKNPLGLIAAYERAFPINKTEPSTRPRLVIKTLNASRQPEDAALVLAAAARRNAQAEQIDVQLIDEVFSDTQQHDFICTLDIAVSLHRSEGYGLFPLEAMARGVSTIATNYSGNLAFMNDNNSWLVRAPRTPVPAESTYYPPGYTWSEPDVNHCAEFLQSVALEISTNRTGEVATKRARAIQDLAPLLDGTLGVAFLKQRLAEVRSRQ
jgi:Glycosyl transferases group 1